MNKMTLIMTITAVLIVSLLAACAGAPAQDEESQPIEEPAEAQPGRFEVTISGFAYDAAEITVQVGTTVRWTNNDSAPHTVTNENGEWDSGTIDTGGTFSYTFEEPGSYPYGCTIHPSMAGTVLVTE